jgi:hypothetical protein
MALPVLRHRVLPSFNAEAAGQTADVIIRRLLSEPSEAPSARGAAPPVISVVAR